MTKLKVCGASMSTWNHWPGTMAVPVLKRVARLPSSALAGTSPPVVDADATQPARGSGATAVAVNATFCTPVVSLPVMTQTSLNVPAVVDENVTLSVTVWPAVMTEPSGSVVVATNGPSAGGFDFVIVRSVPPMFFTVNVSTLAAPVRDRAEVDRQRRDLQERRRARRAP